MATCINGHSSPDGAKFCGTCGGAIATGVSGSNSPSGVTPPPGGFRSTMKLSGGGNLGAAPTGRYAAPAGGYIPPPAGGYASHSSKGASPNPLPTKSATPAKSTQGNISDVVEGLMAIGAFLAIAAGAAWFIFHSFFSFHPNTSSYSYRLGYQHAVQWIQEFGQAPEKQWCDDQLPSWVKSGDWLAGCHRGWENSQ